MNDENKESISDLVQLRLAYSRGGKNSLDTPTTHSPASTVENRSPRLVISH